MKILSTFFLFLCLSCAGRAQELNCTVDIILGQNVQTSSVDKSIFATLESTIREFMNNRKWTEDNYKIEERLECNLTITINDAPSISQFSGSIQIISRRPIYNSVYYSTLMNFNDKDFDVSYQIGSRLEFSLDQHRNNLGSVLAYYAYMMLGYDYDSYALEGGTEHFTKAQQIVSNAANASESGWRANQSVNNRYWLVENALHQAFKPLRKLYFEYHTKGFDVMSNNVTQGRAIVTKTMNYMNQVVKSRPGSINIQAFFRAKSDELSNLYSQAFPQEKQKVVEIFKKADPINTKVYDDILKSK